MAGIHHPSEEEGHSQDGPLVSVDTTGNSTAPEAECMDINAEPWNFPSKTTSPPMSSHLATTSPSGSSPGVPLPPISPRTSRSQDQTLAYPPVQSSAQSHEKSLALEPRASSKIINAQVKPSNLPQKQEDLSDTSWKSMATYEPFEESVQNEETSIEIEGAKEHEKAIPNYLKAALRKYPGRFVSLESQNHKRKKKETSLPEQASYDIDTLLGLNPIKSSFDDYIGPQDPLFVGMATIPSQSQSQGPSQSGNDEDEDDGHNSASGASGAGGDPSTTAIKAKKKRVRKRKGKATGSGATTPSRQPAGMPTMPTFPSVTSGPSTSATSEDGEEVTTPTVASAPSNTEAASKDTEEASTPTAPGVPTQKSSVDEAYTASEPSTPTKLAASASETPITPPSQFKPSGSRYADAIEAQHDGNSSPAAAASSLSPFPPTPIPSSPPTLPSSPPPHTRPTPASEASTSSLSSPRSQLNSMPLPKPQSQAMKPNPPQNPNQIKSPFIPAAPPEKRLPKLKEGERAPTMFSHPQGIDVPRREYDAERVARERAELLGLGREGGGGRGDSGKDSEEGGVIEGNGDDAEEQGVGDGSVERQSSWSIGDDKAHGSSAGMAPFALPDAPHGAGSSGLGVRSSISDLAPRTDVSSIFRLCQPCFL